jgi:ABC-type nitrate/sulfonate/bicarbonate transport system ATPase subunit
VKLEVDRISKRYAIPVLDGVTFHADPGDFVCLLGPNGCGKTTLLRIVGGLEAPTAGEVRLDGRPVGSDGNGEHHIGVVFQEDRLLPWMTLTDNVALVLKARGLARAERVETARRYLRFVGLQGFEGYFPNRVSGGMRQRAAIARALAVEPDLLLMDEPFGSLDAQNRRIMQTEVKRIWAETGKTILFVTHSIEEAVAIGTILVMMSARPARVRELIRIDREAGTHDPHAVVDRLNRVIMEEVLRQQGEDEGGSGAARRGADLAPRRG